MFHVSNLRDTFNMAASLLEKPALGATKWQLGE